MRPALDPILIDHALNGGPMKKYQAVSQSGEFERDQTSPDPVRCQAETMHSCPVDACVGGTITHRVEVGTRYVVTSEKCDFCKGLGVVSKWEAAEFFARAS